MRISLQLVVQDDGGAPATVTEIAQFERDSLDVGSLGLHLQEAKSLLGRLQRTMVAAQVAEAVARASVCPTCGATISWFSVARSGGCRLTVRGCTPAGNAKATPPHSVRSLIACLSGTVQNCSISRSSLRR